MGWAKDSGRSTGASSHPSTRNEPFQTARSGNPERRCGVALHKAAGARHCAQQQGARTGRLRTSPLENGRTDALVAQRTRRPRNRPAMKVAIIKERRADERRVAASPDSIKQMVAMGLEPLVESGAGAGAYVSDSAYSAAGATIVGDAAAALAGADIVLKVQRPLIGGADGIDELRPMPRGAALIGLWAPLQNPAEVEAYAEAGIAAFAMELIPRITRAQTMDVLSSQANLAGYKAVLDAAGEFGRAFPMMMTAAGTIRAARVLVMGAGVAGLQAIATARRLGAIVSATDVRAAAKEQVASLGATFITVDEDAMKAAETSGGYAREMDEDFQRRQREKITEDLRRTDIVICTALIPGQPGRRNCHDGERRQDRRPYQHGRTGAGRCQPALCPQPAGLSRPHRG